MDSSQLRVILGPKSYLAVVVWGETTAIYEHKVPVVTAVTEKNYDDCLRREKKLEDITDNTHRKK